MMAAGPGGRKIPRNSGVGMAPGAGEASFKVDAVKGSFPTDLLHTWCTPLWIYDQAEVERWHHGDSAKKQKYQRLGANPSSGRVKEL